MEGEETYFLKPENVGFSATGENSGGFLPKDSLTSVETE